MFSLLIWVTLCWLIWGIYVLSKKRISKLGKFRYLATALFFSVSSYFVLLVLNIWPSMPYFVIAFLISTAIGLVLSLTPQFYRKIIKGRYFLVFHPFNIFMQQLFIYSGILLLRQLSANSYSDWYFGIFFAAVHLPILFIKKLKPRYWYLLGTFVGGTIFSYLISNYYFGIIISFLIHYCGYIVILSIMKSEDKI